MRDAEHDRWLLYAIGGGVGHFTRTVALARAVRRRYVNSQLHLLTNCPLALNSAARDELPDSELHYIAPQQSTESIRGEIRAALDRVRPDVAVVDSFPRGLGGELVDWLAQTNSLRVLTHRDLNPAYIERYELHAFVKSHYDLLLSPGEHGSLANETSTLSTITTAPWLIRDASELASPAEARRRLEIDDSSPPFVAVLAAGMLSERPLYESLAEALQQRLGNRAIVRLFTPPDRTSAAEGDSTAIWPLLPWLRAVDLLIGAGGYNTVYEARATGTPLLALAQPRRYDRQQVRLVNPAPNVEALLSAAEEWVVQRGRENQSNENQSNSPLRTPDYVNGVHQAVQAIVARRHSIPDNSTCASVEAASCP